MVADGGDRSRYWRAAPTVPSSLTLPGLFLERIVPGASVLDVGCGEARIAHALLEKGARYVGLDLNPACLARAHAPVVMGQGGRLPFKAASFDLVLLRAVLTVLPEEDDLQALLREALRVSRALVGVQDFLQNWELPMYRQRYERGLLQGERRGVFHVLEEGRFLYRARHFQPDELRGLVRQAGGSVVAWEEGMAPTRSGNRIKGVTFLAEPARRA